ncbi:hypothetical protein [Spirosoma sp.]|uniref:hypothetical protein n=1 Tax=Spirosoma sp. TaxID=1899569 RepID=UPI003B3A3070
MGIESCKPKDTQPLIYRDTVLVTTGLSSGTFVQHSESASCKVAPDGAVYFAYQDGAQTGRLTLQRYAEGSWQFVGRPGFSLGGAQNPQLALSSDGLPYVVYTDVENQLKLTVQRFVNGSWQVVGKAGFSQGMATEPSLVIGPDGTPYVAYEDRANYTDKSQVVVQRFQNGNWQSLTGGGFAGRETIYPALAVSSTGILYLAYRDAEKGYALMAEPWVAGRWQSVSMIDHWGELTSASLMVSAQDVPYIVYLNGAHRPSVKQYVDKSWTKVGEEDSSPYYAFRPSMAITPRGLPYLTYGDQARQGKLTVQRLVGNRWQSLVDKDYTTNSYGSISIARDSTVYVGQLSGSLPQRPRLVIFCKVAQPAP